MMLTQQEITQFYRIWCALIWGINEMRDIVPKFERPAYGDPIDYEPFIAVRAQLWENPEWIDDFMRENEYGDLTEIDLGILADWRKNFVKDDFVIMKHLKKYSIFMTTDKKVKLYGVCGISNPISESVPYALPLMAEAVSLPFKGRIIYDSLIAPYNVHFGKGIRSSFKEEFDNAKTKVGIIENMAMLPEPIAPAKKKLKPALPAVDTKGANVPKAMSARYMEVAEIIERFCDEKLNDDIKELCLKALAKLCRKRPSPVASGRASTWACGVVYAIGSNNYVFSKSKPTHMTTEDIAKWFGVAKSTANKKYDEISDMLNLHRFFSEFVHLSVYHGDE